jgi:hypothetical protein
MCETTPIETSEPLLILLRRFATESAREEARVFCDELVAEAAAEPAYDEVDEVPVCEPEFCEPQFCEPHSFEPQLDEPEPPAVEPYEAEPYAIESYAIESCEIESCGSCERERREPRFDESVFHEPLRRAPRFYEPAPYEPRRREPLLSDLLAAA